MEKKKYEQLKDIKERLKKGLPTTFQERNIVNIYDKRIMKKKALEQNAKVSSNKASR